MYKVVLIDDENRISESLKNILETHVANIEVVAIANNVAQGIEQINTHKPDIVFLDIEMPDGTGFDLLKRLSKIDFSLVFCTAYDQYAIEAFKYNAIDYILKPFDVEDVVEAVEKAKENLKIKQLKENVTQLLSFIEESKKTSDKIVLKTVKDIFVVQIDKIYNCQSDGGYTIFKFKDDKEIIVSTNLKNYESILFKHNFIKTHQSHIVNINYIERIRKIDGGFVILKNGREIPISSRKKDAVFNIVTRLL